MQFCKGSKEKSHWSFAPGHRFQRILAFPVLLAFFLLIGVRQGNAQVLYGSIVGTVTDNSGAVVPGATVTVTQTETNESRSAATNGSGDYVVSTVPSGIYTVTISEAGFQVLENKNINVTINTTVRVDGKLMIGTQTQTVTVASEATEPQNRPIAVGAIRCRSTDRQVILHVCKARLA